MHDQFGTVDPGAVIEARQETKTTTFPQLERGSCSPRGAVALSALAGVRWLQNRLKNLRRTIARRGLDEKTRENTGAKIYVVKRTIDCCVLALVLALSCVALHARTVRFLSTSGHCFPGTEHMHGSGLRQK